MHHYIIALTCLQHRSSEPSGININVLRFIALHGQAVKGDVFHQRLIGHCGEGTLLKI